MKKFFKNKFVAIALATMLCLVAFAAVGCEINSDDVTPTQLTLNSTKVELEEEQTFQLVVSGVADGESLVYSSNNTAVAMVSSNGLIVAVSQGNATIKCVSGEKYALCSVTVLPYQPTQLLSLSVKSQLDLYTGDVFKLIPVLKLGSSQVEAENLSFVSSAEGLVSVTAEGLISAKASGKATVTTTATYNGKEISATTEVQVSMPQYTLVKSFNESSLLKGESVNLDVSVFRGSEKVENVSDYVFSVDDEQVASVEDGILTAKGKGSVNVTVSCIVYEQQLSLSFSLTVREQYSVSFVADGNILLQKQVLDGESVEAPSANAPKGKTFGGWYANGVAAQSFVIQQDTTFEAHWIVAGVYFNQNATESTIFSYTGKSDVKTNIPMFSDNAWLQGIMKAQPQDLQGSYTLTLPAVAYSSYSEVAFTVSYNYGGICIKAEGAVAVASMETNKLYTFSFVTKNGATTLFVDGTQVTTLSDEIASGTSGLTLTFDVPADGSQPYAELTFSQFFIYNVDYILAMQQIVESLPQITPINASEYADKLEEYISLVEYLTDYERSVYVEPQKITLLKNYLK